MWVTMAGVRALVLDALYRFARSTADGYRLCISVLDREAARRVMCATTISWMAAGKHWD